MQLFKNNNLHNINNTFPKFFFENIVPYLHIGAKSMTPGNGSKPTKETKKLLLLLLLYYLYNYLLVSI